MCHRWLAQWHLKSPTFHAFSRRRGRRCPAIVRTLISISWNLLRIYNSFRGTISVSAQVRSSDRSIGRVSSAALYYRINRTFIRRFCFFSTAFRRKKILYRFLKIEEYWKTQRPMICNLMYLLS